jgi:hypothetical protein
MPFEELSRADKGRPYSGEFMLVIVGTLCLYGRSSGCQRLRFEELHELLQARQRRVAEPV